MEPAPIGANRPYGRPRHALTPVLLRLLAVTAFAFAGWIVLSALNDAAFAAQPDEPRQNASTAPRQSTLDLDRPAKAIEDHPVRYLQSRRHDVFDGKDRAVRYVRKLADAAGVPHVRIPDVRPDAPIVGRLVHQVADARPVLDGGLLPEAQERPAVADDGTQAHHQVAPDGTTAASAGQRSAGPGTFADDAEAQDPGHCPRCGSDPRGPVPGPALPSGQDNPRGGGSGGHPFAPVADLRSNRYPVAPPAVDARAIHRTALTDVSALGGPSVVPD